MSDSQRPHGLQPTRLLCPWDSPGKSTGLGCHRLLRVTKVAELKSTGPAAMQEADLELLWKFTLIGGLVSGALHRLWLGGSPAVRTGCWAGTRFGGFLLLI